LHRCRDACSAVQLAKAHGVALQRAHLAEEAVHLRLAVVKVAVSRSKVRAHDREDPAIVAVLLPRCAWRVDDHVPLGGLQS
jgi:hypothetical protein